VPIPPIAPAGHLAEAPDVSQEPYLRDTFPRPVAAHDKLLSLLASEEQGWERYG